MKTFFRIAKFIFICTASTAVLAPTWISLFEDEPLSNALGYYMIWDDTLYSKGFRESIFRNIRIGDSREHVDRSLGAPLVSVFRCEDEVLAVEYTFHNHIWYEFDRRSSTSCAPIRTEYRYTLPGLRSNYHFRREIGFDEAERVKFITATFDD